MEKSPLFTMVSGADVINRLVVRLKYTRVHIIGILKEYAKEVGARKVKGRWRMPPAGEKKLFDLVKKTSGLRYRSGERGPQRESNGRRP